jgi:hypothetical protein
MAVILLMQPSDAGVIATDELVVLLKELHGDCVLLLLVEVVFMLIALISLKEPLVVCKSLNDIVDEPPLLLGDISMNTYRPLCCDSMHMH